MNNFENFKKEYDEHPGITKALLQLTKELTTIKNENFLKWIILTILFVNILFQGIFLLKLNITLKQLDNSYNQSTNSY